MITYNKESLNRIAQSLEKMAGVNPDPPSPSGSGVMTCRITGNIANLDDSPLYLDKTYREISDFVANGGMVQAVGEALEEDAEDRATVIFLLSIFMHQSLEGRYFVLFMTSANSIEFYSSDIDGVLSTTMPDVGPN